MAYTTESFIKKATARHNGKYDYSKVEYKGCNEPVCIICPEHGEFWQRPNAHLNNHGCPQCGVISSTKLQSKEKWVEKARKIHGDKYDYSKVKYEGWDEKVCIICPEHGEFWQKPSEHIRKNKPRGCPKCGRIYAQTYNRKTTEQFIKDSINVHGNKYDYSKVEYKNANTKVCIICPDHGEFWQTPNQHQQGSGCPKCAGLRITTEEWVKKAKGIHGNKYDYSKVEYINANTKICVICPEHGEFWQIPNNHLKGVGCYECWKKENFWTYEKCYNIAKQYLFKIDFFLEKTQAYNKAREEGWLDKFDWLLTKTDNGDKRTIYAYEFSDGAAYVGLTNWLEHRDYQHRWNKGNSSVYDYSVNNNIEIPIIKVLEENVNSNNAGNVENKWIKFYRDNGWKVINKVKGGSLGATNGKKYTRENILEETKQYKNQEEVYNKNRPLYNAMRKFRLVKECFPKTHFKPKTVLHYDYSEEFLKEITSKYKKKSDLRNNEYRVYHWLYKHNRLYDFYEKASEGNMNKKRKPIFKN